MERILITYATTSLGLRVTRLLSGNFEVEKATSDEIPSVLATYYSPIPRGANPIYAHELLKLALDRSCQYVLPLGLDEVYTLAETAILFDEYGVRVLCPAKEDLVDVNYLKDPSKDFDLCLINDQIDMVSGEKFNQAGWDGLCVVSDSAAEFVLVVI